MRTSNYEEMRSKPRFDSDLKATCLIKEQGALQQECRVINLSSSGASVRLPRTEGIRQNTAVAIDIPIPDTIMHISTEGEIVWIKQRFNDVLCGVRFVNTLSSTMIQRLTQKNPGPPFPRQESAAGGNCSGRQLTVQERDCR